MLSEYSYCVHWGGGSEFIRANKIYIGPAYGGDNYILTLALKILQKRLKCDPVLLKKCAFFYN